MRLRLRYRVAPEVSGHCIDPRSLPSRRILELRRFQSDLVLMVASSVYVYTIGHLPEKTGNV
jgi:hypothetical protein